MGKGTYMLDQEARAEELIAAGQTEKAINFCAIIVDYYHDEEE